jgi:anti-anti-sigma factor
MTSGQDGPSATVEVRSDTSGALTLAIAGELDLASVGPVHAAIDEAVDGGRKQLVFDLGDLTFMDSSGIAMMLKISKEVDSMVLRNVTPIVRRVIEVTGLVDVLGLDP